MKHNEAPVLYIITKLELGGAQKVCLELFNGLQNADHSAFLISGNEGPLVDSVKDSPNVFLLPTLKREVGWRSLFNEIKTFRSMIAHIRALKKEYPNLIVHTHSTKAGLVGRWAAYCAGVKTCIHTIHGYAFHDHQSAVIWAAIFSLELITSLITTHFICVSSHDATIGKKLFPGFAKKYSMIRAAVDQEPFYQAVQHTTIKSNDTFIFGTVSCFKPQKNLLDLLQAFYAAYQKNNRIRLEILGDGILRPALEEYIQLHQLQEVVTLHGWQSSVAPFMAQWDSFVLSSLWEGLPCSIVEARLLKLPIISYNTGGIADIVSHGSNGFLCDQKNWHQLAENMLKLSTDKQLHETFRAFPDDLSSFDKQFMIKKHRELYQNFQ